MDNCCLCFAQEMLMELNEDTEFLVKETLKCLDIKYVRINIVCVNCLEYLNTVGNFLVNYVSFTFTFTTFLRKETVASSSVAHFSSIIDWCNGRHEKFSKCIKWQNEVICELSVDTTMNNSMLHTPPENQLPILYHYTTNLKKQSKWKKFRTFSCINKFEQNLSFLETKAIPEENQGIFCVKSMSDTNKNKSLKENLNLKNYMWIYEGGKQIARTVYDGAILTQPDVKANLLTHTTNGTSFQCTECGKFFKQRTCFNTHLLFHASEKLHQCTICKQCYNSKGALNLHLRTHSNDKPYQCTICKKSFSQSRYLKNHLWTHTNEKRHQCAICKKLFKLKSSWNIHLKAHANGKPYSCTICKKSFSQSRYLKNHLRTHTNEKLHQCPICRKIFDYNSNLKCHLASHTDDRPHQCAICKRSFNRKDTLSRHLLTHSSKKPYQCTICKLSFIHIGYLKYHLLIHTNEKPHQCTICKKTFRHSAHLKGHLRVHTNEKPYQCTICNKSFTQSRNLKNHLKTHTNETLRQ